MSATAVNPANARRRVPATRNMSTTPNSISRAEGCAQVKNFTFSVYQRKLGEKMSVLQDDGTSAGAVI